MLSVNASKEEHLNVWPGFVDILATVLMVIVFVLMTFVAAYHTLFEVVTSKEADLNHLSKELDDVSLQLSTTKNQVELKRKEMEQLRQSFETLVKQLNVHLAEKKLLSQRLTEKDETAKTLEETVYLTNQEKADISQQLVLLNQQLEELMTRYKDLEEEKKQSVLSLSQELDQIKEQAQKEAQKNIGHYRSEFFEKLVEIIKGHQGIRVVVDRFIFQSEVLFEQGSANLGEQGKERLKDLSKALMDIMSKIPDTVPWILRVDGHTDDLPIKTSQFPTNWHLSSARAIAVVSFLQEQGIPASRLVAAGFSEFSPLASEKNLQARAKNRRIEFKLDSK
ncbi:MAG TPA: OmpA family protein [Alphaproteobacteria bacterium]|nr:OmpA family protein [Alphaproteobacteria bacterium]